jgi:hypothetical protein
MTFNQNPIPKPINNLTYAHHKFKSSSKVMKNHQTKTQHLKKEKAFISTVSDKQFLNSSTKQNSRKKN